MQPLSSAHAQGSEVDYWAVIVGISENQYVIDDTLFGDDDARDLYEQLAPIWGEDHIKLLIDGEATKANIENSIYNWLDPREDANDTVLFFFSGHGSEHSGDYYICPHDSLPYSYANDIRDDELAGWLDALESENTVVILDSCFSGGFIPDLSVTVQVILASSAADEGAGAFSSLGHAVFSYSILEAFDNPHLVDTDRDYEISAEEIFYCVEPKVVAYTQSHPPVQHPQLYDSYAGELSLFVIASFNSIPRATSLTVDGTIYSPWEIPASLLWLPGSVHECEAPITAPGEAGTRYVFTSWSDGDTSPSRTISRGGVYTAGYKMQHYLTVTSDCGDPAGKGWYDEGTTAWTGTAESSVDADGTRYTFLNWIVDGVGQTVNPVSVIMDSPHTAVTDYKAQHYLTVISGYGDPKGEGWYDSGSVSEISVTSPVGRLIRQVCTGWRGDSNATTPTATVLMDGPKTVIANWRAEYLYLYVLIGGVPVLAWAVSASIILTRRRGKTPHEDM